MHTRTMRRTGVAATFAAVFAATIGLAAASRLFAQGANAPDQPPQAAGSAARLLNTYQLTQSNVDKTIAAGEFVVKAAKNDPSFLKQLSIGSQSDQTFDQIAARIEANPVTAAALKSAGISGHDFIGTFITFALSNAYVEMGKMNQNAAQQALQKMGPVAAENVAYVGAHPAQLKAMTDLHQQLQQLDTDKEPR